MRLHSGSADRTKPGSGRAGFRIDLLAIATIVGLLAALPAGAAAQPPGRAWELVSPAEKGGSDVDAKNSGEVFTPIVSPDGETVVFTSLDALPTTNPLSSGVINYYRAERSSSGWASEQLNSPLGAINNINAITYKAFSSDLMKGVQAGPAEPSLTPEAGEGSNNLYLHDASGFHLVTVGLAPNEGFLGTEVAGYSKNLGHVVIGTNGGQLEVEGETAPPAVAKLIYDWDAATGKVHIVGHLPNGEIGSSPVAIAGPPGIVGGGQQHWNPVSADGSRIFFYTPAEGSSRQLYVRIGDSETRYVSESKRATPDPTARPANFWFASGDGSVAFFTSARKLTEDATTGPTDSGEDLYRYDVETEALTDVTVDAGDTNGAQVQGVVGVADNGSRVYFVAKGVLASGATAGAENLYLWTDDGSAKGSISFITGGVPSYNWSRAASPAGEQPLGRVTPDGMHALIESTGNLTSYDSAGHLEAYLYDAGTGRLVCASCNPSGAPATADALAVGSNDLVSPAHTLSDDGSRVFFSTAERLAAGDTNSALDAYEYDATTGQVNLISSGTGEYPSPFSDATANGSDVLFVTRQPLVGIDRDQNYDAYDARIGGGIAAQNPPATPAPCVGQACRGAVAATPGAYSPASSTVNGPKNAKPKHKHVKRHRKHHHRKSKHRKHRRGKRHGRR